jgi:hypothetical protein
VLDTFLSFWKLKEYLLNRLMFEPTPNPSLKNGGALLRLVFRAFHLNIQPFDSPSILREGLGWV